MAKKSQEERNRLVEENLNLAVKAVDLYANKDLLNKTSSIEWEDLLQVARLGLMKAAEFYKPESGVKFSTYAMITMKNTIISYQMSNMTSAEVYSFEETLNENYEKAMEPAEMKEMEFNLAFQQCFDNLIEMYPGRKSLPDAQPLFKKLLEGMSLREAANTMGMTYAEANSVITGARMICRREACEFAWLKE